MAIKTFEGPSSLPPLPGNNRILDPRSGLPVIIARKKQIALVAQEWCELFLKTIGLPEDAWKVGCLIFIAMAKFIGKTERECIDMLKADWNELSVSHRDLGEVRQKVKTPDGN
jgi:hypothetical protein